jgi:hypothetical protein
MGFRERLNVAVLDDRNRSVTIPDQKIILIASDSIDEAHYICAFLSSKYVASTLQSYLGIDASTHILDFIGLRAYMRADRRHSRLAELSLAAHHAVSTGKEVGQYESEIDSIVGELVR